MATRVQGGAAAGTTARREAGQPARPSARERLLASANELFYSEGVQTVGIDRIIEHAGVAKASLYNTFGNKEGLVRAYLESRRDRTRGRIARAMTRYRTPRERLLGVFESQGEMFTDPDYNGCAFVSASAEAGADSAIAGETDEYRAWMRGMFTDLSREAGAADPELLARQLHLLYDGAMLSARMDRDPTAASTARAAAAVLLNATLPADRTDRADGADRPGGTGTAGPAAS